MMKGKERKRKKKKEKKKRKTYKKEPKTIDLQEVEQEVEKMLKRMGEVASPKD